MPDQTNSAVSSADDPASARGVAAELAALARWAHARGWLPATSGNFSMLLGDDPLRLAITASGRDKGELTEADIVVVDGTGAPLAPGPKPSAEVALHSLVARECGAKVIAHVHSLWATIVSASEPRRDAVEVRGLEILKALEGVTTHHHREVVPVFDNTQDWNAALPDLARRLRDPGGAHAFLIRGHGLYTWASDVAGVKRHLEAFEYVFEIEARRRATGLL